MSLNSTQAQPQYQQAQPQYQQAQPQYQQAQPQYRQAQPQYQQAQPQYQQAHPQYAQDGATRFAGALYDSQGGAVPTYQNGTAGKHKVKKFVPLAVIAAVIVVVIVFFVSYTAPNIDRRIIGEWECTDEKYEGRVIEFKRNGTAVLNEGSDNEEKSTYTAENGVITFEGELEWRYRVINSNTIEIEYSHISYDWEEVYEWYRFRRID